MARKTFISYKYSESKNLRDKIIRSLGADSKYYEGETADSPDQTDRQTETIKENLKEMLFDTSVTIVIVSPKIIESNWIDWEIKYSLKEITRGESTSRINGIIGVIAKSNGSYDWVAKKEYKEDGCIGIYYDNSKFYEIIYKNRFNLKEEKYICEVCQTYSTLEGSYISFISEDNFLDNPKRYIENAYDKSQNIDKYRITKEIKEDFSSLHQKQELNDQYGINSPRAY